MNERRWKEKGLKLVSSMPSCRQREARTSREIREERNSHEGDVEEVLNVKRRRGIGSAEC